MPGIDEDFAVADVEHERQRIRMAMRGDAEVTERARIHQQPHFVRCFERRAHQVVAGLGKLHAAAGSRRARAA